MESVRIDRSIKLAGKRSRSCYPVCRWSILRARLVSVSDHIRRLGLDQAAENALAWAGVGTVADLTRLVERGDLGRIRGIGAIRQAEIERVLHETRRYLTLSRLLTGEQHPVAETCLVRCLDVPGRVVGALDRAGMRTIAEALQLVNRRGVRDVRGVGELGQAELQSALVKAGFLRYGRDDEEPAAPA